MRSNIWEEEMFKTPLNCFSSQLLCPSPDRAELEQVFMCKNSAEHDIEEQCYEDQGDKKQEKPIMALQTNLNKEIEFLGIYLEDEADSSYHQSFDLIPGRQTNKKKIPLNSAKKCKRNIWKTKKIKKNSQKKRKGTQKRKRTAKTYSTQEENSKNLKAISKNVLSVLSNLMPGQTISSDDLARIIIEQASVDKRWNKNIRRRLYDAVNVLQAVGKVSKSQRTDGVQFKNGSYTLIQPLFDKFYPQKKIFEQCEAKDKINQITQRILQKYRKIQILKLQRDNLSKLMRRNIYLESQQRNFLHKNFKIFFPFLIFEGNQSTNFSFSSNFFGYNGPLQYIHHQLELLSYLCLEKGNEYRKIQEIGNRRL